MVHGLTLKMNNGSNNTKRRIVSISAINKANDGTYIFIGRSELYGRLRDTKAKVKRVRRHIKPTHYE